MVYSKAGKGILISREAQRGYERVNPIVFKLGSCRTESGQETNSQVGLFSPLLSRIQAARTLKLI